MGKKSLFILYPFIFALFPTLQLYAHNRDEAALSVIVLPILFTVVVSTIVWLVFKKVFRSSSKASIITSLLILLNFSYGHIYLFYTQTRFQKMVPIGPNITLLVVFASVFILTLLFLKRVKTTKSIDVFFLITATILVISPLWQIGSDQITGAIQANKINALNEAHANQILESVKPSSTKLTPDIYYLIFDRYARKDILENHFEFDNSSFLSQLEERGFYVANKAVANYPTTYQSLSSSLNMIHLKELTKDLDRDSNQKKALFPLLQNHTVLRVLKKFGYSFFYMGDIFSYSPASPKSAGTSGVVFSGK